MTNYDFDRMAADLTSLAEDMKELKNDTRKKRIEHTKKLDDLRKSIPHTFAGGIEPVVQDLVALEKKVALTIESIHNDARRAEQAAALQSRLSCEMLKSLCYRWAHAREEGL